MHKKTRTLGPGFFMYILKLLATGAIDTNQVLTWVYYTCVIFLFK